MTGETYLSPAISNLSRPAAQNLSRWFQSLPGDEKQGGSFQEIMSRVVSNRRGCGKLCDEPAYARSGRRSLSLPCVRTRVKPADTKLEQIRAGKAPRVLDLFAGCGGLSLGFHAAGFNTVGAIESDPIAAETYARSFFGQEFERVRALHAVPRDITKTEPHQLAKALRLGELAPSVDVIIGGPPCQAYARVARAKLREVAAHPRAFLKDPRSNLYLRFLAYIKAFRPLAILMENVPDALNHGGHNIAEETSEVLQSMGYNARYTLLNSANYGVPQMRERMFLLAYAADVCAEPRFPKPTHWVAFPSGYEGTRRVALKHVETTLFANDTYYTPPPVAARHLPKAVTAADALADLPAITAHLEGRLRRGARRFTELASYRAVERLGEYAKLMRSWPGFESQDGVMDHVIRSLPRDYAIFREMNPGDQYPQAFALAERMLERQLRELERRGKRIKIGSSEYRRLRQSIVPPYDPAKFPNKWRKMEANFPARTLMAHLGKDGYSHIHYDSQQARTISVREAARLQSFPDGFRFCGTMNPAFRQIGNAVPPLLARAIAHTIIGTLRGDLTNEQTGPEEADRVRSYAV